MTRRTVFLSFLLSLITCWAMPGAASAGNGFNELGISVGGIFPQGNFVSYAEPGENLFLRMNAHIPRLEAFSLWFDLTGSFFSSEDERIPIYVEDIILTGEKTISQYAISLHAGLQLGSGSRRGFFRPRVALAPGLYVFDTRTTFKPLDYEENLYDEHDSQVRFGWRGVAGVDLFFKTRWGISIDFLYDQVINLHQVLERTETGETIRSARSARFHAYMIGIVFPLGQSGHKK